MKKAIPPLSVDTPELNKVLEVSEDSQRIGEFLEWLAEQEIVLAEWVGREYGVGTESLMRISQTREQLLANYFEIDLVKAEKERQALLDAIRAENERK